MTTTNENIQRALHKCFTLFTPNIGRVYENQEYNPNLGAPYLRSWLLPGETLPITLGPDAVNQYTGVFQIDCVYPKGRGWADAKIMAGKICSHFYRGRQVTYNNILLTIRRSWPDPGVTEGDSEFYRIPVSVLYWCFDNSL